MSAPLKRYTRLQRRTPMRRVSPNRLKQYRTYIQQRKVFLAAHPYCQVWLKENGVTEEQAKAAKGIVIMSRKYGGCTVTTHVAVPASEEIHHVNKRRHETLLDESHWLAVSSEMHRKIENHKAWARAKGYLANI